MRRDELATKAEDRANLEAWQKERDRLHEEARADREAWQSGGVLCPRTMKGLLHVPRGRIALPLGFPAARVKEPWTETGTGFIAERGM